MLKQHIDKMEKLYKRWRDCMGGDDPDYDNEMDDFLNWVEYEVEQAEDENE